MPYVPDELFAMLLSQATQRRKAQQSSEVDNTEGLQKLQKLIAAMGADSQASKGGGMHGFLGGSSKGGGMHGFLGGSSKGGGMHGFLGGSGASGSGSQSSGSQSALVSQVKNIQKSDEGRQKWIEFVEANGWMKRDPALRTEAQLNEFLSSCQHGSWQHGGAADMASILRLAQEIKSGQKNSDEYKAAWYAYCDEHGNAKYDPMKHDEEFLKSFLFLAPQIADPCDDPDHPGLVQTIKEGQRSSNDFKEAWYQFCTASGRTKFDPAKHESAFLIAFLRQCPANMAGETGGGMKRKAAAISGNPTMSDITSPEKQALVDIIKKGQRESEDYKEYWRSFCREYGGSSKYDPAIRDQAFLLEFIQSTAGEGPAKAARIFAAMGVT